MNEANFFYLFFFNCFSQQMVPAKVDNLGRVMEQPIDTWEPRSGVALALTQLAPLLSPPLVTELASFFVSTGLGDKSTEVRKNMLAAALATVDLHGKVRSIFMYKPKKEKL